MHLLCAAIALFECGKRAGVTAGVARFVDGCGGGGEGGRGGVWKWVWMVSERVVRATKLTRRRRYLDHA